MNDMTDMNNICIVYCNDFSASMDFPTSKKSLLLSIHILKNNKCKTLRISQTAK